MRIILAVLFGLILGYLNARVLFVGSAFSLIPWGIVGLFVGFLTNSKKEALLSGALYGFVLSFIFMVSGYSGSRPMISVLPFFVLLGLFGAVCGLILGFIGYIGRQLITKERRR